MTLAYLDSSFLREGVSEGVWCIDIGENQTHPRLSLHLGNTVQSRLSLA
jgi:hypothetical protein